MSTPFTLDIYYQNVRGLNTKLKYLNAQIPYSNFNVFAFTEMWLSKNISSSELGFYNYNVYIDVTVILILVEEVVFLLPLIINYILSC